MYVSLNSPLLSSTDNDGILCGVLNTAKQLLENNVLSLSTQGNTNRWGYFMLNPMALKKITNYVELGKVYCYMICFCLLEGINQMKKV